MKIRSLLTTATIVATIASLNANGQSRYEESAHEAMKETAETVKEKSTTLVQTTAERIKNSYQIANEELQVIFPNDAHELELPAQAAASVAETYLGARYLLVKSRSGRIKKAGQKMLAFLVLLDGASRTYVALKFDKSPGYIPVASIATHVYRRANEQEKSAFINNAIEQVENGELVID